MRILLCNYEYPPLGGGGGVMTAHLAEELAQRHEVTVLTSQGLGAPPDAVENGVRVIRVPVLFRQQQATASFLSMLSYIPMGKKKGRDLLKDKDRQFDVINTHFALPTGPVGDALARAGRIPNVLTVIGGDIYDPSKITSPHRHLLLRSWVRRLLRNADFVVGDSGNILDYMHRFYTPEIDGTRIPLGIHQPVFQPSSREVFGFGDEEILMVTVGRLVARKAVDQLIAMVAALRDDRVRLVVIGSGPQEPYLREECRRRQVTDRVSFMGYVEESAKFQLLQMSDVYVSTSQHEGFGLVFLEAMHCGLPVVCYDEGGQTDFLSDGETGHVVPLNDLDGFVDRCRSLMDSAELRRSMGTLNQGLVKEYYIENAAQRYEEIFSQAMNAPSQVASDLL